MRRIASSWTTTLRKLGFKRRQITGAKAGYRRRSSLEQLEPRQLLANAPWAGSDLVVADFDGDGNQDRLSDLAASGTAANEFWFVDTKASTAATPPTTETWRVMRGDGAPPAWSLPQHHVVGDFSGDGRDDILARSATGPWYVVESRGSITVGETAYSGQFVISLWGTVPTTGGWTDPIVGDFNGDGRDDLAAFNSANPSDLKWEVMRSTGTTFEPLEKWVATSIAPGNTSIASGDFNGDGREDLWFKKSGTNNWAIAISDGTRFNVFDPTTAVTSAAWPKTYKGDFDGDDAVELMGWNAGASRWDVLNYDDHLGMTLQTSWGNALGTGSNTI